MAVSPRTIHVVAGILLEGGRVCITRRRQDSHQGGKWEFPGGKLDAGEDALAALKRELHEELGIEVRDAYPFMHLRHSYADLDVLLDVWCVTRYHGVPHGREAQELRWAEVATLDSDVFPAADRPVLKRLQLPALYIISDVRRFGEEEFILRLERALAAGARLVQLREPWMERPAFCAYARRIVAACNRVGARLLVNTDPAWFPECGAHGLHLNSRRLMNHRERPISHEYWLGASCHDAAELHQAQALDVDFAVLGPVQPTASHPGRAALGWERFVEIGRTAAMPIFALGGMQAHDLARARIAGARGLAMIGGVWGRADYEAVVRALTNAALPASGEG